MRLISEFSSEMENKKEKDLDFRIKLIAEKVQRLRKEKGYTSYENFAWDKGLPRVQYWRMEKGINFTIDSLLKILDIHKITLKEFFEDLDTNGEGNQMMV